MCVQGLETHMENKGRVMHIELGDHGAALLPRMCGVVHGHCLLPLPSRGTCHPFGQC